MRFDWDPAKNGENLLRHGLDFGTAILIFDGPVLERIDDRFDYGEIRLAAIGILHGVETTVYYTDRAGSYRIISARKATKNEREAYYEALYGPQPG